MKSFMTNARENYYVAQAVRKDYWVRNTGPWTDEDGNSYSANWEECDRSDPDAQPDVNRAIEDEEPNL